MKKFSNLIDFNLNEHLFIYTNPNSKEDIIIDLSEKINQIQLFEINESNQLISILNDNYILYIKEKFVYLSSLDLKEQLFDISIEKFSNCDLDLNLVSKIQLNIKINGQIIFSLNDIFAPNTYKRIVVHSLNEELLKIENIRDRFIDLANLQVNNNRIFITYDRFLKEIALVKEKFIVRYINENISLKMLTVNRLQIQNKNTLEEQEVNLNKVNTKPIKLTDLGLSSSLKNEHILSYFTYRNKRFYVFNRLSGVYIVRSNPRLVSRSRSYLKSFTFNKSIYLIGIFKHNGYKAKHKYDNLYLQSIENPVGRFKRPFRRLKFLNQFAIAKIDFSDAIKLNRIHSNILCGNNDFILHNIKLNPVAKAMKTLSTHKFGEDLVVLRNNLAGNATVTTVPFSPEYKFLNKCKNFIASKIYKKSKNKNVNLFFEKKSERAEESSIKVFDKIYHQNLTNSENYFILDEKAPYFNDLKTIYGNNLIKKYSFSHYAKIYKSNYFISSELPNHLINDRLYLDNLREKIMSTPSVFLQHGIMFAKPVDNPMAYGFHKGYNKYNNIKNVVSSDLEATQFYKMGYNSSDLIKTGLATFDNAILDDNANKIAFMPTYRFWEEKFIYSGNITETSYFHAIMNVINKFIEFGLLDRLLIVPHNKFSEFIVENMPEYKDIICSNPSIALKESIIFITDYSSAIYDSIYRGAYPIFYWEERDYLIENYKAIPPVNEFNAPGPVAFNLDELMTYVENAILNNYQLEEKYRLNYKMINEFDDNNNTQRIINELSKINIL